MREAGGEIPPAYSQDDSRVRRRLKSNSNQSSTNEDLEKILIVISESCIHSSKSLNEEMRSLGLFIAKAKIELMSFRTLYV